MQPTDDKLRRRWVPRFTVRRLMIVIASIAVMSGVLLDRGRRFQRLAEKYRKKFTGEEIVILDQSIADNYVFKNLIFENLTQWRRWHRELWLKYEWAARHPWLPVWPDPPQPE